ncbi:MAG TPA: biopolymer transporter ExbD [Gammaproteobacteria bacterium]|nr:biopolymer transporter ExbD [Gammaproteobacteria bacterium]
MQVIGRSARMARHHKRHDTAEINLTSMIDMMTILVFFLLVHGGFIRLAMLELNLPSAQSEPSKEPQTLQLEITVREGGIEVGDRSSGALSRIDKTADGRYDLAKLTEYLTKVKQQFPDKSDATLLLEPDIQYDSLVAVMDRIRVAEQLDTENHRVLRNELFPDISIGDAPPHK